jgi:LysR family transcriptional regulator, glycine cleavage system transcriptional activator
MRAFEAAARHLSFKRASAELAVTPTAISHQIRLLEDWIGLKLFERRPRQLLLTIEGQRLYPALRDGFDSFAKAVANLQARRSRSVVTLSATRAFTARWLVPRTPSFAAANPGMDLRLHAAEEPVDFNKTAIDVALRYRRVGYSGLKAEELFRNEFAPVASPNLGLREPTDLRRQTLIHFEWYRTDPESPIWPFWLEHAGMRDFEPKGELTFTDESHAIQAALAGQGVALLDLMLVADELGSGALVQPFGPVLPGNRCFLVYPEPVAESEKIAAVRSWIWSELRGGSGAGRSDGHGTAPLAARNRGSPDAGARRRKPAPGAR